MSAVPYECSCPSNALPMEQWCVTCRDVYGEAREPLCWKCRDTGAYRVARADWLEGARIVVKKCGCKAKVSTENEGESA